MSFKPKTAGAYLVSAGAGIMLLTSAMQASADHHASSTITDIVAQSGGQFDRNSRDFDILLTAVVAAGLADTLADKYADFTVFAPNDRAFIHLARDFGFDGHDEEGAYNAIVAKLTELDENCDPIAMEEIGVAISKGGRFANQTVGFGARLLATNLLAFAADPRR